MIARVLRLFRFEWRKLLARRLPVAAFVTVALVALLSPQVGHIVDTAQSLMKSGQAQSSNPFDNGWTALAGAVATTRLFLAIVLLILAGSSLAEECSHGTLQALFVRPLRRIEVLAAKFLAIWSYSVLLLVFAVAMASLGAELDRGLYDVVDPDYPDRLTHAFGDMCGYVYAATVLTAIPLAALTAMGLLASVLFDHPGYATGVAIGALFLASAVSGLSEFSGQALFVSYLGAPFEVVADLAGQYTNVKGRMSAGAIAQGIAVPALWAAGLFFVTAWRLQTRDVGRNG